MSEKLLPGNQFAICTYNTAVDALVVTHARAIHPSSLLSVIMKLNSSLWPWRLRNIKDLFFVPSQLQMNIFISQSQSPPFSVGSPSLRCFPFGLKSLCCRSQLADDASFLSETHLHSGFLVQILLPPSKAFFLFCISFQDQTNNWTQQWVRKRPPAATDRTICIS